MSRTAAVCRGFSGTGDWWWHLYVKLGGLGEESAPASIFLWSLWGTMVCSFLWKINPWDLQTHLVTQRLGSSVLSQLQQEPQASTLPLAFLSSNGSWRSSRLVKPQALLSPLHQDNEVSIRVSGKWMMTPAIDPGTGWEQYYNNPVSLTFHWIGLYLEWEESRSLKWRCSYEWKMAGLYYYLSLKCGDPSSR